MKASILSVLILAAGATLHAAPLQIGDAVPNLCWKNALESQLCLSDHSEKVRVLVYGAGWCPGCNEEMDRLVGSVREFEGKPVLFVSLMAAGWTSGSKPDAQFLAEWTERHLIPFPVLASPKDAGKTFFEPPFVIPNAVIVGKDGKLVYKEMAPEIPDLLAAVREALDR